MKALHFARPFEYRLDIPQDQVTQGATLAGSLTVLNRDGVQRPELHLEAALAQGSFTKVKGQGVEALEIIEQRTLAQGFSLPPSGSRIENWSFALPRDCWATGKDGGMFLVYGGDLKDPNNRGFIDVPVGLAPPLVTFITTLENHFSFEARSRQYSGRYVKVRCKPPTSYPTLDEFLVALRLVENGLSLRFDCKTKGLARGQESGVRSRKMTSERELPSSEILTASGQPNRELFRKVIHEFLEEALPGGLLPPRE